MYDQKSKPQTKKYIYYDPGVSRRGFYALLCFASLCLCFALLWFDLLCFARRAGAHRAVSGEDDFRRARSLRRPVQGRRCRLGIKLQKARRERKRGEKMEREKRKRRRRKRKRRRTMGKEASRSPFVCFYAGIINSCSRGHNKEKKRGGLGLGVLLENLGRKYFSFLGMTGPVVVLAHNLHTK